jgi:putative ABC transport system permease protein/lipoprotein-releasing system permease protein
MNPLSPTTYYQRHKRSASLLLILITLSTLGLYIMVSVLDSIPLRANVSYLTRVSRVYPVTAQVLDAGVVSQVQAHPDVAHLVWDNGLKLAPPTLIGLDNMRLIGVSQEDAQFLLNHYHVRIKEGRMFSPRTNEFVLSEEIVRALGLKLGDQIDRSTNERYYGAIPAPMRLVGILEGDPNVTQGPSARLGLASYEYLESHEAFAPRIQNLLVIPRESRKETVDEFLETTIASEHTETETFREISQLVAMGRRGLHLIFGIVNTLVAVIVAMVVGVINRIALMRRLPEYGLLNALGYHKERLIARLTLESAVIAAAGWGIGLMLSLLFLAGLRASLYYAKGMELDLTNPWPLLFTLPIPAVVVIFAAFSAKRVFARFDSIAIIERGKLSMETEDGRRTAKRSSPRPLSSRLFYQRHRRRGVLLVVSMALMILGVAFPVFLISLSSNTMMSDIEYLRDMSEVAPDMGNAVDPGVTAQIRSHPAVADIIQTIQLGMQVNIPPGSQTYIQIYGVSEEDLPVLIKHLDIHLVEGRLPQPRSNEFVISAAVAQNRGLRLGDTVGRPVQEKPAESALPIEDDIPTEMIVAGLLSGDDLWVGFASLEYLESHEFTSSRDTRQLVIPFEGVKSDLDAWLEQSIASSQTTVTTYETKRRERQQTLQAMLLMIAGVEFMIAAVAAIALAILNHIFYSERKEEFGLLNAIGRSRSWLVLRTVRETGSVVGIAWLIGAAVCLVGIHIAQATIYAPQGLKLDFFNPAPWLFTLPIPLTVIAVGVGTISRTLSHLDPVSVIERR